MSREGERERGRGPIIEGMNKMAIQGNLDSKKQEKLSPRLN